MFHNQWKLKEQNYGRTLAFLKMKTVKLISPVWFLEQKEEEVMVEYLGIL